MADELQWVHPQDYNAVLERFIICRTRRTYLGNDAANSQQINVQSTESVHITNEVNEEQKLAIYIVPPLANAKDLGVAESRP
jgi:hypothetical protein